MAKILVLLWLIGLSLFDIRYKSVPVWMVLLGGAGIICGGFYKYAFEEYHITGSLWGMAPGILLLLLAVSTGKAGWVDGVVLLLLGSALGIQGIILTAMFSLILISILSVILLVLHRVNRWTRIPYIPCLTVGYLLSELIV